MAEVQLKDAYGNDITPKGSGTPSAMPASQVTLASGTGLSSSNVQAACKELNDKIENSGGGSGESATYDVAKGNLDESCLIDDEANSYVGYMSLQGRMPQTEHQNTNIVAWSCDDGAKSDYVGTRKITNKYNFRVTYNCLIKAPNALTVNEMPSNYKKLYADGNDIGFHGLFNSSYFWRNLMYDVRSDETTTFSPTLTELKTKVNSTYNVFNVAINDDSTFTTVRMGGDASIANVKLKDATESQWFTAAKYYSVYGNTSDIVFGQDLNGTPTNAPLIWWLEYWYNELVDNTLGYSKTDGTTAERFAEDYSGTYPDAAHILSGELSDYGTFTKGLFKGCHSCCNFEVLDRILTAVEAFVRRMYGWKHFTNMCYHGGKYSNLFWRRNGVLYINREMTVIATGHTPLYLSLKGRKMNLFDVVESHGIRMIKRQDPEKGNVEGEIGLYRGQRYIRGAFFNDAYYLYQTDGVVMSLYLALLGTTPGSGGVHVPYDTFMSIMPSDQSQWHKFAYEHAGQELANGIYMKNMYKLTIDIIRRSVGTGKIPYISVDTNEVEPTMMAATELVYQYCYRHGFRVCTTTEAMNIANQERVVNNAFPNPSFYQSLIEDFGGSSTSADAYIPDGFYKEGESVDISVTKVNNDKVLTLTGGSDVGSLTTRVYGLPSGKYRISMMAKSVGNSGCVKVYHKLNKDVVLESPTLLTTLACGSDYEELYYDITIPEPHKNLPDGTYANTVCDGYEDNVAFIQISFEVAANGSMSVYNPRIDKI